MTVVVMYEDAMHDKGVMMLAEDEQSTVEAIIDVDEVLRLEEWDARDIVIVMVTSFSSACMEVIVALIFFISFAC